MAVADQRSDGHSNSNSSGSTNSGGGSPDNTATTTTTSSSSSFNNNNNQQQQQQCSQMESITHQLQNAGLYATQQAYLLQQQQQQQQYELEQQFQVQALLHHQQQQQRNAQAFATMSSYLDSSGTNQRVGGGREQDMDMIGMLPVAWPQSSRVSSRSPSERWTFDQLGTNGSGGYPEMQSGAQVFFAPMDFPLVVMDSAESMKTQASSSALSTSRDGGFDAAMPHTQNMYGKLFQQSPSHGRIGLSSSSASNMGANFLNRLVSLSNQFEMNDSSGNGNNGLSGEAIFQPVLDSASLEPLDDTSLELLVSSLNQINSDPGFNQMANDEDNDGELQSPSTSYTLSEYLRRSPDMSKSFSDSSSVSSSSSRSSPPQPRSAAAGNSTRRQGSVVASGAVGSRVIATKKPKRIRRLCTQPNCGKRARSHGLCIAHGGGRRCAVDGCGKSSQGGNMCIKHGGGKRCSVSGCNKAAQTNSLCKAHGGGPRCQIDGCNKSSQGGGFCRSHGGGKRCATEGCDKGTQRGDYCALHGGSRFCEVSGCRRNDRGGGLCAHHGGGKRCGIMNCARPCRRNGFCSTHLRLLCGGDDSA